MRLERLYRIYLWIILMTFGLQSGTIAQDLSYYFPKQTFSAEVTSPEEFLGFQIGEWHISHDQLHYYLTHLAKESDRVHMTNYAQSHEDRPLSYLTITSKKNHKRLAEIKANQQALCDALTSEKASTSDMPVVIYQGYSIHGNESSGSNAAVLVAYYLAAGQGEYLDSLLDNVVILLDPCYNPDGLNRFASWVNSHKSKNLIADKNNRELNEAWPRGRTNHYWFDLNRDWLLLTHPESQGRIKVFHEWKPSILTDHHEMGSDATFFFQPGIPSRTNPNTPPENQKLTEKIGEYHAAALDDIGSLYYNKESFDDFYYGKGSTYPDGNGCIGILFEQASSRGHLHETIHGDLSFPFTIKNQVVTSLSTQKAASEMREELLEYKRQFYKDAQAEARKNPVKAYRFSDVDKDKLRAFLDILSQHKIDVFAYDNPSDQDVDEYVVPMDQQQSKLVKTIFESVTQFRDSLFYDVSAWTFPHAFDLDYSALSQKEFDRKKVGSKYVTTSDQITQTLEKEAYAYALPWDQTLAPRSLYKLLNAGIKAKVTTAEIRVVHESKELILKPGSIIIPVKQHDFRRDDILNELDKIQKSDTRNFIAIGSGQTKSGPTLGSRTLEALKTPKVAMLVGSGVNAYDAGEIWHTMDHRFDIPLVMIEKGKLTEATLNRFNTLILADGDYKSLSQKKIASLKHWIHKGGNLICFKKGTTWAINQKLIKAEIKSSKSFAKNTIKTIPYNKMVSTKGAKQIGGSIFNTKIDRTHPLAFGYQDEFIPLMKRGTTVYKAGGNPYSHPLKYTSEPLLSGYIHKKQLPQLANTPSIHISKHGKGIIIGFADNPLFRGYWWGGFRLFMNAVFFADIIKTGEGGFGHAHE